LFLFESKEKRPERRFFYLEASVEERDVTYYKANELHSVVSCERNYI